MPTTPSRSPNARERLTRAHYTAQLVALRREQGRLDELLPELERFARDASTVGPWHAILPLAYLDAGDRARARATTRSTGRRVSAVPRTVFWLASRVACGGRRPLGTLKAPHLHAALAPHADLLAQWSFTGNAGSVHRLLGRTAAAAQHRDRAREHFESALRRHAALGSGPLLARTRCDYGELLLTAREPTAHERAGSSTRRTLRRITSACRASPRAPSEQVTSAPASPDYGSS